MNKPGIAIVDHVGVKAGMECYDQDLYFALKDAGCNPVVFSNFQSSSKGDEIFPVFEFKLHEGAWSFLKRLRKYVVIKNEIRKRKIDSCILHAFRFGFWDWWLVHILKETPCRIFLIIHDPESLAGIHSPEKWRSKIFAMAERLLVHNQFSFNELSKDLPDAVRSKLSIIPHGNFINPEVRPESVEELIKQCNFDPEKKRLLFFGQIKETKGLDLLLHALADTDPSVDLIVAGRMRHHSFDAYQSLIERYGLQKRVRLFIEYISPVMRNMLFQVADAVVLPYRKVYQSGVLLMAMSYGKAVIASDLQPNREIISAGQNGFLFEAGNLAELTKTINFVLKNDSIREAVADKGLQYVLRHHDWKTIGGQWTKIFNQ